MDNYELEFLIEGDDITLAVTIPRTANVQKLRGLIYQEKDLNSHRPGDLKLFKVEIDVQPFLGRLSELRLSDHPSVVLDAATQPLSKLWEEQPPRMHIHIMVKLPAKVAHRSLHSEPRQVIRLNCFVLGNPCTRIFPVEIELTKTVGNLKDEIKEKEWPAFDDLPASAIVIWKVSVPDNGALQQNLDKLQVNLVDGKSLRPTESVSEVFSGFIAPNHVHVVVKSPTASGVHRALSPQTPENSAKRPRLEENEALGTPSNVIQAQSLQFEEISPRLSPQETEPALLTAFEPFTQYITYLAEGKLDVYFNSISAKDLVTDLNVKLLPRPMLLLHGLGESSDMGRIKSLFIPDTVHLFAVSGSGKTRLSLEALCHHWGFYISCQGGSNKRPAGSCDFQMVTQLMRTMSKWDESNTTDKADVTKNVEVASRAFAMLICARVFVLKQLLEKLPPGTDPKVARRRWVLVQVLPPSLKFREGDIFSFLVQSLRRAQTDVMLTLAGSMLNKLTNKVGAEIFPHENLFAVVDEAQVAAVYLTESFRSLTTGIGMRPVLHAFHSFLWSTGIFQGVILAGTGLSMKMVQTVVSSRSAQVADMRSRPFVFVEVGRFMKDGTDHQNYICKYLSLPHGSHHCISDQRLVERILYWFPGRYRLTASLIELLYTQPHSRHRILSAFVKALTNFTLTDAVDLEEGEPTLTVDTIRAIEYYQPVSLVHRLYEEPDRENMRKCMYHLVMRWRIGSQATSLPIEHDMHETVALGIGHLEKIGPSQTMEPNTHYPVYLCEPLVVLQLSSFFGQYPSTQQRTWIEDSFRTARNNSAQGFILEEVVLLVLLQEFGGKNRVFSDVFHCNQPWGSREMTLVSLKRTVNGAMRRSSVSWTSGSSDRLGFKATSPEDVLTFLDNPGGKPFLFPDNHMGPDLMCFLQEEETKELILLAVQIKLSSLDARMWQSALDSVTSEWFYKVNAKDGRKDYAPSKYPNLSDDIRNMLASILESTELVDEYRQKPHEMDTTPSQPLQKAPRYLRIIVSPDDAQNERLNVEVNGDIGVLRWEVVNQYLGSTATIVGTTLPGVH